MGTTRKLMHYLSRLRAPDRPPVAAFLLRQLTWRTDTRFNELVRELYGVLHPPRPLALEATLLGPYDPVEQDARLADLERRGFHVFTRRLPDALSDELLLAARTCPCTPRTEGRLGARRPFEEQDGEDAIYIVDGDALMQTSAAQRILADGLWLDLAQRYLGCEPVLEHVTMWWSTAARSGPANKEAQLFHMDMDLVRFLNFFVYLTDVTPDTGPHTYVAGSQGRKPKALHRDGRFSDEELSRHYPPDAFHELTGPRGTVIAADTFGFHKGKPPRHGNRLIFQFVFAINRFGKPSPNLPIPRPSPELAAAASLRPRTFEMFTPRR